VCAIVHPVLSDGTCGIGSPRNFGASVGDVRHGDI